MNATNRHKNEENREIPYFQGMSGAQGQRQAGGSRKQMAELIAQFQEPIVKKLGSVFVSAQNVLEFLQEAGHLQHVTKSNGIGDVLGAKHFNLPYAPHAGKRRYLLPAITWDKEARDAFFALSPDEKVVKVRTLEKELLGIDNEAWMEESLETVRQARAMFAQEEEE